MLWSEVIEVLLSNSKKLRHFLVELPGNTIGFLRLNTRPALRAVVSAPKDVAQKLSQDFLETFVDWFGSPPRDVLEGFSYRLDRLFTEARNVQLGWAAKQRENFSFISDFRLFQEEFGCLLVVLPTGIAALDWLVTKHLFRDVLLERVLWVACIITGVYGILLFLRLSLLGFLVVARLLRLSWQSLLKGAKALSSLTIRVGQRVRRERSEKSDLFLKCKKLAQASFLLLIWPIVPGVEDYVSLTLGAVHWLLKGWAI